MSENLGENMNEESRFDNSASVGQGASAPEEHDRSEMECHKPAGSHETGANFDIPSALVFPSDVDWSTTLLLKCDPEGAPYHFSNLYVPLSYIINPYKIWHVSSTELNHVFTLGLRDGRDVKDILQRKSGFKVKNRPCYICTIPSTCAEVTIHGIPLEIDTSLIIENFKAIGKVVKTELVRAYPQGWRHSYTGERLLTIDLKSDVTIEDIPDEIEVKGIKGSVKVRGRRQNRRKI